jgi:DNA-3-methyladenine glycosylase
MSDPAAVELGRRGRLRGMDRAVLDGPAVEVARALLGTLLVRVEEDATRVVARLVETEAYDQTEPAAHTHRGRTLGNATMFGRAGHAYVYFTYGMHHCANVVCGPPDHGAAVLLRAARVLSGHDAARRRRPAAQDDRALADGPAKLTQALGLDRAWDGVDLCDPGSALHLARDDVVVPDTVVATGPRVGVRQAADRAWRFWIRDVPEVSTSARG